MTLIAAKFDADLVNISEVASRKTKWPRFLAYPVGVCKMLSRSIEIWQYEGQKHVLE